MVFREQVQEAQIPLVNGYIGVLPEHAPLLGQMKAGMLTYKQAGRTHYLAVGPGFVEVLPHQTKVLAETAEKAEEIDPARAEKARERAEQRLRNPDQDTDVQRARASLDRAMSRIQTSHFVGR